MSIYYSQEVPERRRHLRFTAAEVVLYTIQFAWRLLALDAVISLKCLSRKYVLS